MKSPYQAALSLMQTRAWRKMTGDEKIAAASAGGVSLAILADLATWGPLLALLGIIVLVVVAVSWRTLRADKRMAALGLGLLFIGLAIVPSMIGTAPGGAPPGTPPGGYVPHWEVFVPSTVQGTPRDAASEIFDTQGATACSSIAGQGTLTLDVSATNMFVDRSNKLIRVGITRNANVATSTAAFQAPDCHSNDFSIRLTNPVDANGDGVMDSASIFGRVRSITSMVTIDGNGSSSQRNILFFDTTFGHYLGWSRRVDTQATDGMWISAVPPGQSDTAFPSSADWTNLGASAGADEDYIAFAYAPRNYGFYGFTLPPAGFVYSIVLDIGVPADYTTYTVQVYLSSG